MVDISEVGFFFSVGAIKDICEICPEKDIERLEEAFEGQDLTITLDHMAVFITTLNRWYCKRQGIDIQLTADDFDLLSMDEIKELQARAMKAFRKDTETEVEVSASKKNA